MCSFGKISVSRPENTKQQKSTTQGRIENGCNCATIIGNVPYDSVFTTTGYDYCTDPNDELFTFQHGLNQKFDPLTYPNLAYFQLTSMSADWFTSSTSIILLHMTVRNLS